MLIQGFIESSYRSSHLVRRYLSLYKLRSRTRSSSPEPTRFPEVIGRPRQLTGPMFTLMRLHRLMCIPPVLPPRVGRPSLPGEEGREQHQRQRTGHAPIAELRERRILLR